VEVEAELKATENLDPNTKETDAAPDDHVRERQAGPSISGLLKPNTPTS
jgi:hypothetical protein